MSAYMSRLFPRSNSSFFLRSGNALDAKIVRLREEIYLVDAGVGPPRIATRDELVGAPKSAGPARFSNRVGFLSPSSRESPVKNQQLERCFVDLVTGDPRTKERAAVRFSDMVGQSEAVGDCDQPLLLPRKYRKRRAWMELRNLSRSNAKVKGFIAEKVWGGYSVAIAGYLGFLSTRSLVNRRIFGDRFMIERMNPKSMDIMVTRA